MASTKNDSLSQFTAANAELKEIATQLSERILRFETWLNTLPSKTATEVADDSHQFRIRLARKNNRWRVETPDLTAEDSDATWIGLSEAPLALKIKAVKLFGYLIEVCNGKQAKLVEETRQANSEFDKLAEAYKIP